MKRAPQIAFVLLLTLAILAGTGSYGFGKGRVHLCFCREVLRQVPRAAVNRIP